MAVVEADFLNVMAEVLDLQPHESPDEDTSKTPLSEILWGILTDCQDKVETLDHALISEYVFEQLNSKFVNLSEGEDNFRTDQPEKWCTLLHAASQDSGLEFVVFAHILLNLSYLSLINAQKLSRIPNLKDGLWRILTHKPSFSELIAAAISELYTQVLAADCCPKDVKNLYEEAKNGSKIALGVLNTLGNALSDPSCQSYIYFENGYKSFEISPPTSQFCIQIWAIFHRVTSNRIFSLNNNLFIEIRQSILCISDDEFVLAMFETFEFTTDVFYNVTLNVTGNAFSLYVDGAPIETILIPHASQRTLRNMELGSMISSFKVFKFRVWSEPLFETCVKLTNQLPLWQPGDLIGNSTSQKKASGEFDASFLQDVCQSIETPGMTMGLCAQHAQQLRKSNLVINFAPLEIMDGIEIPNCDDYSLIIDEESSHDIGKILYFKRSPSLACFEAICVNDQILSLIQGSENLNDLYEHMEHFTTMMRCTKLRSFFEETIGYDFLSVFLGLEVLPRFNASLSLPFMNLFLEFCGWDTKHASNSILKNGEACSSLLLNFNWWTGNESSFAKDPTIEILRYLFFQFREMLENSKFSNFNYQQLTKLQFLDRLTMYLDLSFSSSHQRQFAEGVRDEIAEVLKTLLKKCSRSDVTSLFHFAYYEVKKGLEESASLVMVSLNCALLEMMDAEDEGSRSSLLECFPVKLILMIIDAAHSISVISSALSMLIKFLELSPPSHSKFVKNNGYRILFDIIKETKYQDYEELISVIVRRNATNVHHSGTESCIVSRISSTEPDSHCLIVDLLEWTVLNDIRASSHIDVSSIICNYMKTVSNLQEIHPECVLFDARRSSFLGKLLGLLMTLQKPQNTDTYCHASQLLTSALTNALLYHLTSLNSKSFADQLLYLIKGKGSKPNRRYLEQFYWLFPFGNVLQQLETFIPSYTELFQQSDFNIVNIVHLLEMFTSSPSFFDLAAEQYLHTHAIATSCTGCLGRLTMENQLAGAVRISLRKVDFRTTVAFFGTIESRAPEALSPLIRKYIDITLMHQFTFYGVNKQAETPDLEAVSFLFTSLAWCLSFQGISGAQSPILNCLRIIVLHHEDLLEGISNLIDRSLKAKLMKVLLSSLSASDEDLLKSLSSNDVQPALEAYTRKQIKSYSRSLSKQEPKGKLARLEKGHIFLTQREAALERRLTEIEDMHKTFSRDGLRASETIVGIEDRKLLYFRSDREDELILFCQRYREFEKRTYNRRRIHNCGITTEEWTLDATEDSNRMRRRLIPNCSLPKALTHIQELNNDISKSTCNDLPECRNSERRANSIMSFEVINELDMLNFESQESPDRNRKVLKMLQKGDMIRRIWNCSNVVGLNISEGVLVLGHEFLYFLAGFFYSVGDSKVVELWDAPPAERDPAVELIRGSGNQDKVVKTEHSVQRWKLTRVSFILRRPFLLRDSAIEISFDDGTGCFYTFRNKYWRDNAYQWLERGGKGPKSKTILSDVLEELAAKSENISVKNGLSEYKLSDKVANVFSYSSNSSLSFKALKLWQSGQISNFYYLTVLNTLAGRTFNDITQYPVFPWVIADYHSEELDFRNPQTFRDLSKPMGAQSEPRKQQFTERFDALKDLGEDEPPFHYGTHYSSAMIVSSYMMRLKPFVDSYLLLQDGKFGHADRLFNSIERTWTSASQKNTTDVRELIPEFFYLPDFLKNVNSYELGLLQNGDKVDNVLLPPWAKNDPKLFIAKNREALECPFVSQRLHDWIDLVFGFKQTGEAAVQAVNVFNKLSYPGAVNLDKIDNENERKAVTGIIHNFGQSPLRIFDQPHPRKSQCSSMSSKGHVFRNLSDVPTVTGTHTTERARLLNNFGLRTEVVGITESTSFDVSVGRRSSICIGGTEFYGAHNCRITCLEKLKGNQFCTADELGLIKLWKCSSDGNDSQLTEVARLDAHLCSVKEMYSSCQYNMLLTLDLEGNLFSWDTLSLQVLRSFGKNVVHSTFSKSSAAVLFVNESNIVTICDLNGSVYLEHKFDLPITVLTFLENDDKGLDVHSYQDEIEIFGLGFSDGLIEIMALIQGSEHVAWELKRLRSLTSGSKKPLNHLSINTLRDQGGQTADKTYQVRAKNKDSTYVWS
ncbi:LAME_0G03532g1_1 [Lachancea meyersii CBS 8951]|uniref:Beige protein homolog 1 n=1 Tax=Lachancea meyersii CBS 8951 TaxID=1266667 RepID=A0A1G4K6Q2_9SACH|nr:LAME_0G03532g1_1 [Lachancea meyersii CBS 8951]